MDEKIIHKILEIIKDDRSTISFGNNYCGDGVITIDYMSDHSNVEIQINETEKVIYINDLKKEAETASMFIIDDSYLPIIAECINKYKESKRKENELNKEKALEILQKTVKNTWQ